MRSLIVTCASILLALSCVAQSNFEGKIVYIMNNSLRGNANLTITAFFKDQQIKAMVHTANKSEEGMDDIIIDFKNGIIHYLQADRMTYHSENIEPGKLQRMPVPVAMPDSNKIILGYACSAYNGIDSGAKGNMTGMEIHYLYADALHFPVSKNFTNLEMIPIFTNGSNIGMGMVFFQNGDKGKTELINVTPQSVSAESIPDSVFSLTGYTKGEFDNTIIMSDTVKTIDSLVNEAAQEAQKAVREINKKNSKTKQAGPGKSPAKNTHTQPTKSSAIKPKQ